MIQVSIDNNFDEWRQTARQLLRLSVAPSEIFWTNRAQSGLFSDFVEADGDQKNSSQVFKVSADFLELAEVIACIDDDQKWALLYRLLWRVVHENRHLLEIESDDDVRTALLHAKAIRRDTHKMHAFVRFRQVQKDSAENSQETFIAWHEPDHFIVKKAVPFFVRRFGAMRFSILTPKGCAHWNTEELIYTEAVTAENAPEPDALEFFWKTYYASVFNPARLKVKAMKAELPVRFWHNLPEAELIPDLIRGAEERTRKMIEQKANRQAVVEKLSKRE